MALKREYTLTINKKSSVLNKNLTISTNDKGIDIIFRLIDCPYISLSLKKNLYARVILLDPLGKQIDSDVTSIVENRVLFRLTKNLMSKITEAGIYKLYIAIMDDKNNVNLLPPVKCTIEESEVTVRGLSVGMTNQSSIDNSLSTDYGNEIALFNADGTYNRTVWISGDMITTARMNKLEDAASKARDSILSIEDEIKEFCLHYVPSLDFDLGELQKTYMFDVKAIGSVPQAIYCFLISNDFMETLKNSISIGGDSDTIACIACSIAGAYYGVPNYLIDRVKKYIPNEYLKIINDFDNKFCIEK